jgi:hypothetical protein
MMQSSMTKWNFFSSVSLYGNMGNLQIENYEQDGLTVIYVQLLKSVTHLIL